jgi:saccharopine dehydrogenase-like NADP-dependent oxidoreductase
MTNKNILVLGSGLIAEPCIEYLLKDERNFITIGSKAKEEAERLIENLTNFIETNKKDKNLKNRLKLTHIDVVKNKKELHDLVNKNDLVISLIPTFFQIYVIRACFELKKHLLTTNYISEELKNIDKKVKEKNLVFMFESGVSPGLDHIIANKVIREQEKLGNTIIGYESWVGAIPSPECVDNPLLYKFSWDPKGALLTLKNDAKQLINGKVVTINEKNLLTQYLVDKKFHPSLNLEAYYNGNSLKYKELYNLKNAKNVIRGIIRYQGFTFIIQCFKFLNLFSFEKIDEKIDNWKDLLNKKLKNPRIQDNIYEVKDKYLKKGHLEMFVYNLTVTESLSERMFYFNLSLLAISYFEDKYVRKYGFENLFHHVYSVLTYLEFFNEENKVLFNIFIINNSYFHKIALLMHCQSYWRRKL